MGYQITHRLVCLGFGLFMSGTAFAMPAQASESDPQKFLSTLAREATTLLSDDGLDRAERAAAAARSARSKPSSLNRVVASRAKVLRNFCGSDSLACAGMAKAVPDIKSPKPRQTRRCVI